jgi:regulator of PEP synthase PpsR (kinase-PPPase family)
MPRRKCIGLMIAPEKLNEIRKERIKAMGLRADVNYASYERIYKELAYAEEIMRKIRCPIIDVSNKAVEETASLIIEMFKNREELAK